MFEVLIALMISFLFLTGTLNAMVISAVFQVKAERQAQASYWIQEDLEEARAAAANYVTCTATIGQSFNSNGLPSLTNATRKIVGTDYTINRVADLPPLPNGSPDTSSDVSTLTYTVSRTVNGQIETLATLYTEVLPAAALTCP
ncbi:MAG: hypothetical protein ACK58N_07220 [Synechocystis sp.]|jgi:hypothetical protein